MTTLDLISRAEQLPWPSAFKSFFMAGFECSSHRVAGGRRLDMIAASAHDRFSSLDYARLQGRDLRVAREGVRWHLVEHKPGAYDFSSVLPIVRAAQATGTQVIWDLCHFGWPDHLDIFKPQFITALADFGAAFARWLQNQTDEPGFLVPVNEISFFSWAAGDEGCMYPFESHRGFELKTQLVRAAIATMDAVRSEFSDARFIHVDPIIHVIADPRHPEEASAAEFCRLLQFQALDMLAGRVCSELGGGEKYLDIIGVNFYPHNQWFYNLKGSRRIRKFCPIHRRDPRYKPFHQMLREVHDRYGRPMIISETGAESRFRAEWLNYVCEETSAAIRDGVPVRGICLYPILNHPGWDDQRHCRNGLWDYADARGHREIYLPLAAELKRWNAHFAAPRVKPARSTQPIATTA